MNRRAIAAYVAVLALAAVGCGAALARLSPWPSGVTWGALPFLVVLLAAAECVFITYQIGSEVYGWNLFEPMLAPLVLGFPGMVVVAAVAGAQVIAACVRRNEPIKAAFNVAQWSLAAGAGALAFSAVASSRSVGGRTLLAVAAALVVATVVNDVAFVGLMALVNRRGPRAALDELLPIFRAGWTVVEPLGLTVGLLIAAAYAAEPYTVILFAAPMAMVRWASLAYADARADRNRLAGLQRATHALSQPVNPLEAISAFLAEVKDCFEVEVVDLVLLDGAEGRVVHRLDGGGPASYSVRHESPDTVTVASVIATRESAVRVTADSLDLTLAGRLREEGWRDCVGVPLTDGVERWGSLCTYNRVGLQGFEDGGIAVLQALGGEMASTLQRAGLVESIIDERRKLDQIVSATSDGIATIAADGTISSWNPALEVITGYDAAMMVGSTHLGLLRPHAPDGADVLIERWAERGEPLPDTLRILTRSGEARCLACSYSRAAGTDGSPSVLIVVARDVTEAQKLVQLKDDLIATVSHEFRTPLVPIKGWAEILAERGGELSPEQREAGARTILRHSARLEQLVVNFLEVAKVERDFRQATMVELDVVPLAQKVVDEFRSVHPDRSITLEVPRKAVAVGHGLWVEQILTNLLANAVKYSGAEAPVDVGVVDGPDGVRIAVVDRGPGIAPQDVERAFARFERLESHVQAGTGLGLYIARQLATALGATITLESEVGQGSVFTLTLRAARALRVVG